MSKFFAVSTMQLLFFLLIILLGTSDASYRRNVVDHPVLFKMPDLKSNNKSERRVLTSLDNLKTYPGVITLLTGRLLKDVNGFTHGLFARFPDQATLLRYYYSRQFLVAILPQVLYLRGEDSVDYNATVYTDPSQNFPNEIAHVCFFRFKLGVSQEQITSSLASIYTLADAIPGIVLQVTAGTNFYDRDFVYSYSFVARLASEHVVDDFYAHPAYKLVVVEQLKPICFLFVEADIKPIQNA